jgi:hypothetical protein
MSKARTGIIGKFRLELEGKRRRLGILAVLGLGLERPGGVLTSRKTDVAWRGM